MFPDNWQIRTLSFFVSELQAGVSVNSEDRPCRSGEIGILKTSAITGGNFNPQEHKAVLLREQNRVKVSPEEDSIIVSRMNTLELIGESSYIVKSYSELFLPDRLWLLKFRDRNVVSIKWLSYVLSSQKARSYIQLHSTGTSGSMKNLPQSRFLDMPILSPSFKEQQKIAEILDTVEKAIALTQTHINKLKLAKAGLLHDLLTKGIDEHGELRNPKRNPEQFKDSPLGIIPKDWDIEKLEYVCERITDGSHQSVTTSDTGIPFLYVSCVRDGQILWEQAAKISNLLYIQISKGREPKTGLILYTAVGSYGHAALVKDDRKFSFQRHIAYVLPNQEKIIPGYLCLWLNSSKCKNYADKVALGNAQKTVTLGALGTFPVAFPLNLEQQNNIVESFDGYNKQIMNRQTRLEKLKLLKLGLMSDLLTGKVRVKI